MRYPLDDHRAAIGRPTRDPDACTCAPVNPRHAAPWHCLPPADLAAWRARHPECVGPDDKARVLLWLEREFSTPRERVDERGMTAIERMMFDDR